MLLFFILLYPFLLTNAGVEYLWSKSYLTYSIESDLNYSNLIQEAIQKWKLTTLEIEQVDRGKGDIKIYFETLAKRAGIAFLPEGGVIKINPNTTDMNFTPVIQHEFGHALGLGHSKNIRSVMFPYLTSEQTVLEADKEAINELYKCRYDSVTLLNGYTYLKFKGKHYDRIDLNTNDTSRDRIWNSSSIGKVSAMFRMKNNYFIISQNSFYEYDPFMKYIRKGFVDELFPNLTGNITAVLTLRDGKVICFLESGILWYDGKEMLYQDMFSVFPNSHLQGANSDNNNLVYLTYKDDVYIYKEYENLVFTFTSRMRLCDDPVLQKIHCCNEYSNI